MPEISKVAEILDIAADYGLELEVIYFALVAMKENPTLSPSDAIEISFNEWVK
jgi:hypothetical protein